MSISNAPRPARVEAHRVLDFDQPTGFALDDGPVAVARLFTLEEHFARGGYEPCLFGAPGEGDAWLDAFIRDALPDLPPYDEPMKAWSILSGMSGAPSDSVRKRLGCSKREWDDAIAFAVEAELLFDLPFWRRPSDPPRSPLLYFADTGLWCRLSAPRQDFLKPAATEAMEDRAWEGFNIAAIRGMVAGHARTSVWRTDGVGEIDLVLDWRGGGTWAVEISRSAKKRPGPGFAAGLDAVTAARSFIVRPAPPWGPDARGCVHTDLTAVLREARDAVEAIVAVQACTAGI